MLLEEICSLPGESNYAFSNRPDEISFFFSYFCRQVRSVGSCHTQNNVYFAKIIFQICCEKIIIGWYAIWMVKLRRKKMIPVWLGKIDWVHFWNLNFQDYCKKPTVWCQLFFPFQANWRITKVLRLLQQRHLVVELQEHELRKPRRLRTLAC